ncbi:MAG: hypothetical protein PWQ86_1396 [Bacillota bacterium]|nr:hypothetical protein [Bacillota bacterium]
MRGREKVTFDGCLLSRERSEQQIGRGQDEGKTAHRHDHRKEAVVARPGFLAKKEQVVETNQEPDKGKSVVQSVRPVPSGRSHEDKADG